MDILTVLGVSVIAGLLCIISIYFSFSQKVERFYEETNDASDSTGFFIVFGWIIMGLHKLYKAILRDYHLIALRVTLFTFGILFMVISIGTWFLI